MAEPLDSEIDTLIDKTQYEYAIFLLTDSINKGTTKVEDLIRRATCYMHLHQHRNAIKDFEKAIKLDRTVPSVYIKQSKCYLVIGDIQNSINSLQFLRQIDENNDFIKFELEKLQELKMLNKNAENLFNEGKYEETIDIINKCLAKSQTCIKFKLTKAECLVYLDQHSDALDIVNDILFLNKDEYEAICVRALSLMHQEKYMLGIVELREIMQMSPRAKKMYKSYKRIIECIKEGNVQFESNKLSEAESLYHEALQLDNKNERKNRQILLKLARILLKRNEYEKCIDITCDILEYDEKNIKALEYRAKCNLELKEYDLAIEDFRAILKQDNISNLPDIRRDLSFAEQRARLDNDYYKILNLNRSTVTATDIKNSYRKLAKQYHPDKSVTTKNYIKRKLNLKFNKLTTAKNELLKRHEK